MSEELVLRLMPLHPNAQQNEAYSYATEGGDRGRACVTKPTAVGFVTQTRPLSPRQFL